MQLSKNFSLQELTVSETATRDGLKNAPNKAQTLALVALCQNVLQPLRDRIKRPIVVTSGFRSVSVNRRVGGSNASQHCKGQAADFIVPGLDLRNVAKLIQAMDLPFDQLILEFLDTGGWLHVSYSPRHRRQVLEAKRVGGKTVYTKLS
jgi:uncharacterized protein YcbK (DUF882 family)